MKAISIRQPWAWAICEAGKRVENRDWRSASSYRGPLLIHASAGCTRPEYEDAILAMDHALRTGEARSADYSKPIPPHLADLPRGAIVARARLVDVVRTHATGHRFPPGIPVVPVPCLLCGGGERLCPKADPWAVPGALGLILADVVPLPLPIPWKGALGLFDVPILNRGSRAQIAGVREEDLGFGEPAEETLR